MKAKKPPKKFAWNPKNQTLYKLMASTPGVIIINWIFQGMLGMDKSELLFHLAYDLVFTGIFIMILSKLLGLWISLIIAIVMAHTLNFLFNSHFWVMGRYVGISKTSQKEVSKYISSLKKRLSKTKSIGGIVVIGNLTRGGRVRETSDLDVRWICQRGFSNMVIANLILIKEKAAAFLKRFPLDIYLYDDVAKLSQLREDETPILIKDDGEFLSKWYDKQERRTILWEENADKIEPKICIVCSGGGHLTEAKLATRTLDYPRHYVTFFSPHHHHEREKYYHVMNPYRNIGRFAINFFQSLRIFHKEKPDIIITTGASVVISTCLIAKIFRKRVIFIESSGNPLTASATGRFLYRLTDSFYVQWEEQLKFFPKAIHLGSLL